jgi:hypothetical protein
MEVTNDNSAIAVIQVKMERVQLDISDIKEILKNGYATRESLEIIAKETSDRLIRLENSSNLWKWLSPTLAAILGSILTFLLIQYIMGLR